MSNENLKPNVVGAPTLFIGVGGTGSKIVRMVAEMCRPEETENLNFVCMDTNVNDLMTVAKSKARIYYVQTSNTQTVGDYLDYDGDASAYWFPKNAVMYDKTVSEGAGQVRAISRLALNGTIKTGQINTLYEAIDDLFRKTGKELKQALRVCFVSTASGGTGSGMILPLSMLVRDYVNNKYPSTAMLARALIMLPETLDSVISSTAERKSQRRNAYATIKEINAFMIQGSNFFKLDRDLERYSSLKIDIPQAGSDDLKSLSLLPFDFCFLMDGQDAEDSTLESLDQYIRQAAQALYEQNIGPMQGNAFSMEDNIIKELSAPGNLGRNRFGGIGASVLRYPYDDVVRYVANTWALSAIGGEGEAAKWGRYDAKHKRLEAEARKKGLPQVEWPKLRDVYVSEVKDGQDAFSEDLRGMYLSRDIDRVDEYLDAVTEYVQEAFKANVMIAGLASRVNKLAKAIDYEHGDEHKNVDGYLKSLRAYEMVVKSNAASIADSLSGGLIENTDRRTEVIDDAYMIEKLLKNDLQECVHPNAARYLLYMLASTLDERRAEEQNALDEVTRTLQKYLKTANNPTFDANVTRKETETSIDMLVDTAMKAGKFCDAHTKLNEHFPKYLKAIREFGEHTVNVITYVKILKYVEDLSAQYERFYATFKEKVAVLQRRQEDLVDGLRFRRGDSVRNICATRDILKELARATVSAGAEGTMLESRLNGEIFDAIKKNTVFEREIANMDVVEEDKSVDIFDDILLDYFRRDVRRRCQTLDMNVVQAMSMEYRLSERIRRREEQEAREKEFGKQEGGSRIIDRIDPKETERYVRETIALGGRLSAPGISRMMMVEPREVRCAAYNKILDDMREPRMESLFSKAFSRVPSETISKYEMHFFVALYNLTPDKLKKFSAPTTTETHTKGAGLYFQAYDEYGKNIGPDSTKNMVISTHIDKRWDSIAFMPELDLGYQARKLMKIHQALIYALVYKAITQQKYSGASGGKQVYRYEDSEEFTREMIVSNGTMCDEFYEILDALYIDAAVVEDIEIIKKKMSEHDALKNNDYRNTQFAKAVADFRIQASHDGPTSLFEIPLFYYNSLPNSHRYGNSMMLLVDAVIKTFSDELLKWEKADDAKFMLCDILYEQFELLMQNYEKEESLSKNTKASENTVIDTIYRQIRKVLSATPEPKDYEEKIENMRRMVQVSKVGQEKAEA